jgi:CRISPR/Cas system-associated exonuclease Cas4 (RecB family)
MKKKKNPLDEYIKEIEKYDKGTPPRERPQGECDNCKHEHDE